MIHHILSNSGADFPTLFLQVEETVKDLPQTSLGSPVLKKPLSAEQWVRRWSSVKGAVFKVVQSVSECEAE